MTDYEAASDAASRYKDAAVYVLELAARSAEASARWQENFEAWASAFPERRAALFHST